VPCELIGSQWLLQANCHVHSPVARTLKRAIDLVCACAGLLLTIPAWPLVALLIKATSTGPVFYRQDRVGLDGQVFSMIKFRTMCADAECQGAPQWAKVDDNRVTVVGRILRKTRFDEIPQFLNVLRGDMSFVGPRPERPGFVESFRRAIPYYDIRHQVKPGITGWAQIMYAYAASEHETRTKLSYDLYYVKNGTLLFDLEIVLRTLRALMNGSR
jgi:exopolysaccharide biosynthesis polyprenyl glycosylphosphotransferase